MKFITVILLGAAAIVQAAVRTSPPSGCVAVSADGTKAYKTVQSAVDSGASCIFIYPGTYKEQVLVSKSGVTIYGSTTDTTGYSKNTVTITQGKSQDDGISNDETGTIRAHGASFKLYNVNVVNSRGEGSQAIAVSAQADKQGYYGVQLLGYQDTLLTNDGNHYFANSYIKGATDFIFGQRSRAWFENVTINAMDTGFITANGRDSESNVSYYVFNSCNVAGDASSATVYLGRPWRNYSRVVFQNSALSAVIKPAGWSVWNSGDKRTDHVYYKEYANTGSGASGTRASFAGKLSAAVTISEILGSGYTSWVDAAYL